MNKKFEELLKKNWILLAIVLVGIFLRTYHFHDWLYFYPDQARDLAIVDDYLGGNAPLPLLGFKAASSNFQLGAMYSYFQIISASIFGSTPATVAYPDVLFGILTIPLLYYYLRKFFAENISLLMAGLYSVSFYAIRYSRFAWNVNPIPFFSLLFLLSTYELLLAKSRTNWKWVAILGISLGVGVQLHTVLLVFLPIMTIVALGYLFIGDRQIWKKGLLIFLVALVLNTGQIVSEFNSNFKNTQYFFKELSLRSPEDNNGLAMNFASNVVCQSQASVLFLSSLQNDDNCVDFKILKYDKILGTSSPTYWMTVKEIAGGFLVLFIGHLLLLFFAWKERREEKRIFLLLNFAYSLGIFLVILPIITHNGQVRYWLPVIFVPFLSLAIIFHGLMKKYSPKLFWLAFTFVVVLAILNFSTIFSEAKQYSGKNRSNAQYVVLGEIVDMVDYIKIEASPKNSAYIFGGPKYMQNFYRPLFYVASKNGLDLSRGPRDPKKITDGTPMFFIGQSTDVENLKYGAVPDELGLKVQTYKNFGNIGIYKVTN